MKTLSTTPFDPSTRTPSSWVRSPSYGLSFLSSPTSVAASSTLPNSMPLATSSPLTATPTIGPLTPLALTSMSLCLPKGGCIVVDSTQRGKRFPDSMSKTIPIGTCVLNRAVSNYINKGPDKRESVASNNHTESSGMVSHSWDCSLHLPLWVSETEKASIEDRLEEWTKQLEACGADINSLAACLRKPLRPLWVSQKTVIWLNEVPEVDSWDFTPIILVSASASSGTIQHRTTSEFSWNYIQGAGDDEESWARGLSPHHFWKHAYDLISSGPDLCNQKVADVVEKDRVYRAQRGQSAPQVRVRHPKLRSITDHSDGVKLALDIRDDKTDLEHLDEDLTVFWLGSTNLAVGISQLGMIINPNPILCICYALFFCNNLGMDVSMFLSLTICTCFHSCNR